MMRRLVSRRRLAPARVSNRISRLGVAFVLASTPLAVRAQEDLAKSISQKVQQVFELNRDAVVRIEAWDQHGRLEGSGFYADPSGTIYTLTGVLGDGEHITVYQGSRKFRATVLVADPRTGLAVLKVDANTPFVSIGDSSKLEIATPVVSIGYPMGLPETPGFGLVAGFDKEYLDRRFRTTHVRVNLPVQRGLGGAPVLNMDGQAVGIVVAGVDGNAGCFMLPINAAEKVRMDFIRFGEIRPGWIGVELDAAPQGDAPSTARVTGLQPGTPAAESGIRAGDIITRIGEIDLTSPEDVFDASFFLTAGDETSIAVLRDGKPLLFSVRPKPHPSLTAVSENEPLPVVDRMPVFDLNGN